jgi:hypothetical protein
MRQRSNKKRSKEEEGKRALARHKKERKGKKEKVAPLGFDPRTFGL